MAGPVETRSYDGALLPAEEVRVSRIFQVLVAIYVIFTGEIPGAIQAALYGITGDGSGAFTAAFLSALAVDLARLAPLFVLARHPLGVLHPLIIAVVLWPLLLRMPLVIQEFGGLGRLFLGKPVNAPSFLGLSWLSGGEVWWAVVKYNLYQLLALAATYGGFALSQGKGAIRSIKPRINTLDFRRLLVFLVILNFVGLIVFISMRGGIDSHLADLSRGRFRALAGLGPLIAIFDIGIIALVLWVAARPRDVKTPLFLAAVVAVAAAQFLSNGSRAGSLYLLILLALTWSLRTRRIPWRLAVVMGPILFLALGFLAIARSSGLSGMDATQAVASAEASDVFSRVQEDIELRQSLTGTVPVVADGHRVTNGPLFGQSYLAAVFAFVPRYIWEDKPRGPGSLYAQYFLGETREGTAVPVGAVAEAYWNFGSVGLIVLFFIYGLLLKKTHDMYLRNPSDPFVLGFFVIFVTVFQVHTDDLVLFQQQMLLFFIIWLLCRLTVRVEGVEREPAPNIGPQLAA